MKSISHFFKNNYAALKSVFAFKRLKPQSRKIVFYAEDAQSQNFLFDLAKELLVKFDQEVCYLTSDIDDSILSLDKYYNNLHAHYIGDGFLRTWLFTSLEADLMVMTMPDLETFHLKRSAVYNVHYLYIFHALVSTHSAYRLGAFDSYDTVFCVGPHQIKEIRQTEKFYNLNKKNIFRDGYRPLEYLMNENNQFNKKPLKRPSILIAPSWGSNNIFEHCMDTLLDILLELDIQLTIRPHPMTIRHHKKKLAVLNHSYQHKQNFCIQTNIHNRDILFQSDLLITDWSGIGIEYGIGLKKPVIYIDTPQKVHNPEADKINLSPIENEIRSEIGKIVNIDDLSNIHCYIYELLKEYDEDKIIETKEKYLFTKKNSLKKSAKRILSIANANQSRNYKNKASF
tara:strand:+ start:968 stop:2161 length:1194 start_codon:yes stop_codon:yes gene_type:complete